jgi:hypothetical protein
LGSPGKFDSRFQIVPDACLHSIQKVAVAVCPSAMHNANPAKMTDLNGLTDIQPSLMT